jgi:predicted RNA methylase
VSQKPSDYERIEGDRYYTPAWPVAALCTVEAFHGEVIDPAAGSGLMVQTLQNYVIGPVAGYDISPDPVLANGVKGIGVQDFLAPPLLVTKNIITNPPYGGRGSLAVKFIKRALEATRLERGKVAMLLRVDFDSAGGRTPIFGDHPAFAAKYTLTRRIHWANLPLKYDEKGRVVGATENHAWFVWDWKRSPLTPRTYGYLE